MKNVWIGIKQESIWQFLQVTPYVIQFLEEFVFKLPGVYLKMWKYKNNS